jgi:hypothetical protein
MVTVPPPVVDRSSDLAVETSSAERPTSGHGPVDTPVSGPPQVLVTDRPMMLELRAIEVTILPA